MKPLLNFDRDDRGVVTLTMNDDATRNALTGSAIVDEFLAAFERIQADHGVGAVIITGSGKAFSSGGNIAEMGRQTRPEYTPSALRHEYRQGIQRLPLALQALEVPTIAAVNGPAIGAGCDLACMCDIRIASEQALFAESFVKLGLIAGDGGSWYLPRLIGMSRAAEMTFTGDAVSASQALEWGLVSRVVPAAALMDEAYGLAHRITANPADALRMSKRLLREGQLGRLDTVLEMAAAFQALAHKSDEHARAVQDFLERRAARKK
ncbi:crotonase/enoyl-CoA hydratase family protein [Candidimonas nitroreducens]|uniref:Enoyl-CoA hydratase n=1 Tax=Candidimonas nitroreducens TaxID=683354 RepID=A0A225MR88_9BURK|nr:crotonase/enoyl-CoA hydratase family protein [Candidimonas nitroreducens]OWT63766.1 enoyl-CoA hydratase [Candidimonas nitroreducens]